MEQLAPAIDELHRAATALDVNVRFWPTGNEGDLATALAAAADLSLNALFVTAGVIHGREEIRPKIVEFVLRRRLPTLSDLPEHFSRQAASLPTRRTPKKWALERPISLTRSCGAQSPAISRSSSRPSTSLIVNLKIAKALGLTIPPSLLARADQVIE